MPALPRVEVARAHGGSLPVGDTFLADRLQRLAAARSELQARQARGEVGFLGLDWAAWEVDRAVAEAADLRSRADTLLVLGIGGSALGARALDTALGRGDGRLVVLDTVDPVAVARVRASLDPRRTALCVVSKSGGTVETAALFRVFLPWLQSARDDWRDAVVFITDRQRGALRPVADAEDIAALPIPDDVGGRFSVLTSVGMLPAAFAGLDTEALRAGAEAMAAVVRESGGDNPAWRLAALFDAWSEHANVAVMLSYCDRLRHVGEWWQQLWGESLGKVRPDGTSVGWTPTVALGPVDQHSQLQLWQEGPRDKLLCVVDVEHHEESVPMGDLQGSAAGVGLYLKGSSLQALLDAERRGTTAALVEAGRPVVELSLPCVDAFQIGALIVLWETTTALTGLLSGVEPFDQPGVEAGKGFAYGLMGREGFAEQGARARSLLGGE